MNYKKAFSSLAVASLLISSSCLAAGSNPLYSCKDVKALAQQDNRNNKLNFINHTMPNYVANNNTWRNKIKSKLNWINKNTSVTGSLIIFNTMNMICDTMPADYDPIKDPIEDIYFFTVDQIFKEYQKKQ